MLFKYNIYITYICYNNYIYTTNFFIGSRKKVFVKNSQNVKNVVFIYFASLIIK